MAIKNFVLVFFSIKNFALVVFFQLKTLFLVLQLKTLFFVLQLKSLFLFLQLKTLLQLRKLINKKYIYTVDSRYLEVDGTTEIIRLTRSSTQRN